MFEYEMEFTDGAESTELEVHRDLGMTEDRLHRLSEELSAE